MFENKPGAESRSPGRFNYSHTARIPGREQGGLSFYSMEVLLDALVQEGYKIVPVSTLVGRNW